MNAFMRTESQGEIASGNSFGFQAQIEDFHSKCCILGDEAKNKTTGSTHQADEPSMSPRPVGISGFSLRQPVASFMTNVAWILSIM